MQILYLLYEFGPSWKVIGNPSQVGDFGLSRIKRNTCVSGGVRGTLPWMAPELLNGSGTRVSEKVRATFFYSIAVCRFPWAGNFCMINKPETLNWIEIREFKLDLVFTSSFHLSNPRIGNLNVLLKFAITVCFSLSPYFCSSLIMGCGRLTCSHLVLQCGKSWLGKSPMQTCIAVPSLVSFHIFKVNLS